MHCLILSSDKNQDIPIFWQFFSDFNPNLLTVGLFLHILTKALGIFPGIAAVLLQLCCFVLCCFGCSCFSCAVTVCKFWSKLSSWSCRKTAKSWPWWEYLQNKTSKLKVWIEHQRLLWKVSPFSKVIQQAIQLMQILQVFNNGYITVRLTVRMGGGCQPPRPWM